MKGKPDDLEYWTCSIPILVLFLSFALSVHHWSLFPFSYGIFVILISIPLVSSIRSRRLDPFEPIVVYSVFTGMMGAVIFERRYLDRSDWRFDLIPYDLDTGLLIVLLVYIGLLASVLIGYYGASRFVDFSILDDVGPSVNETDPTFLRAVGAVYLALGCVAIGGILTTALDGNPIAMYTTSTPRSVAFSESSHWLILLNALPIGYLLCLSAAVCETRQLPLRLLVFAPVVVGSFVLTGSRGRVMVVSLLLVAFCFYCVRFDLLGEDTFVIRAVTRLNRTTWLIASAVSASVAATGVVVARGVRDGNSISAVLRGLEPTAVATAGVHDDTIDNFLALTRLIPAEQGYYYGTFYLRVITNFVPRAVWEGKPVLTLGAMLRRRLYPDRAGGRPPGEIGTYYANFGYPGIVFLGALFGVLMRALYELLLRNRNSPLVIIFFVIVVMTVGRSGLDNNTLFGFISRMVLFAPVVAGCLFIGRGSTSP